MQKYVKKEKRYRLINFICLLAVYKKLIVTGRVLSTRILRYGRHGLVVERQTPEREVGGSILTQVAVLCPLARYIYLPKSAGNTQETVASSRHD